MRNFIINIETPRGPYTMRSVEIEAASFKEAWDKAEAEVLDKEAGEFQRGVQEIETIEVRIPGAVFYECFDPMATEYPREANLPQPERRRVGKGWQYRYRVTLDLARDMLEHAQTFGEAISFGVDDPTAGRMVVRWVARERARLGWSE